MPTIEQEVDGCQGCLFLRKPGSPGPSMYSCQHPLVLERKWFVSIYNSGSATYPELSIRVGEPTEYHKGCPLEKHPVVFKRRTINIKCEEG